jgi:hypothetical protein
MLNVHTQVEGREGCNSKEASQPPPAPPVAACAGEGWWARVALPC